MNRQYLMKIISRILQPPMSEIMIYHLSMLATVGVVSPITRGDLSFRLLISSINYRTDNNAVLPLYTLLQYFIL